MQKTFVQIGAILGALAVMIGAFGAHALKAKLTANGYLDTFETGVKYHFYHAVALVLVGVLMLNYSAKALVWSGWCFLGGVIIFSGALYTLSLTGTRVLGAVAPIGGTLMILGWLLLFWGMSQKT